MPVEPSVMYLFVISEERKNMNKIPENFKNESIVTEISVSFAEAMVKWLNFIKKERKYSTYVKYKNICGKYLMVIGSVRLTDKDISEGEKKLLLSVKEKSGNIKRTVFTVFNQILKYANADYGLTVSFAAHTMFNSPKKKIDVFNHSEQAKLLRYLSSGTDIYKAGIMLCLSTGLRLGEICSLKWSDIDMETKVLHVNSTVQRIQVQGRKSKTMLLEGEPKSVYSKREIPLSDSIVKMLVRFPPEGRYFLCSNRPMEPRTYQNKLKSYLENAGIEKKNFHTLRHTFATNCVNAGADIKSISEILGHADVKITLNRYVHPTLDIKRGHMNRLSNLYDQLLG